MMHANLGRALSLVAILAFSTSPSEDRIAVTMKGADGWHIYWIALDGSAQRRLSDGPADRFPVWSRDGKEMVFGKQGGHQWGTQWALYVMTGEGKDIRRIAGDAVGKGPRSWSPDGKWIVFDTEIDGKTVIHRVSSDGSGLMALTSRGVDNRSPRLSPDGSRIAFVSSRDGNREIYVMRADGTDQRRLTQNPAADQSPAWSPDGRSIAFVSERDGNRELYLIYPDDTNQPRRLTTDPAEDDVPVWSPAGDRIAFRSHRPENSDVEFLDVKTLQRTNVTNRPNYDGSATWSPDGRMLGFISSRDGYNALYVVNVDGSGLRRLTAAETLDPSWGPRGN